ncbi:MAG: hypothetical protein ACM3ML_14045 [Micromonosporaceae bacterium]
MRKVCAGGGRGNARGESLALDVTVVGHWPRRLPNNIRQLQRLKEALQLVVDPRERAQIALEVAETYAALFRWVDACAVAPPRLAAATT